VPENPRPLAIHLVGHDSLPEDWERALRDIAEALSFYEGCRLPQEVVTTVRNASAGALELVPYYRWLAEQKNLTSPPRCGPFPAKSWVPPASLLRLMNPTDQPPDPTAWRKSHSATLTMWPKATPHSHVVSVSRHLLSISTSPDTRNHQSPATVRPQKGRDQACTASIVAAAPTASRGEVRNFASGSCQSPLPQ
jgi:hypothetical protein